MFNFVITISKVFKTERTFKDEGQFAFNAANF